MKAADTLAQFRRWERTERAIGEFLTTLQESRERTLRVVADHQLRVAYRRERGLERVRT